MLAIIRSRSRGPRPVSYHEGVHQLDEPDRVSILLEYPGHIHYLPQVQAGASVARGQPIGMSPVGNLVHASISGTVDDIDSVWSPDSYHVPAAVIRNDGGPSTDYEGTTGGGGDGPDWLRTLRAAGVASPWTLTGSDYREQESAPLPDIRTVVVKGVHEEPTIFTSQILLRTEPDRVRDGLRRVAEIAPGATIWLTVAKADEKWAAETFGAEARIAVLPDHYRGRIERHVVPRLAGIAIPHRAAYTESGVAVLPAEYLLAMQAALDTGQPFVSKCVTVAGDDLERAVTVRYPIGTPIRSILASQGISMDEVGRLLVGGPMKGIAQYTDRTPLTHADGIYLVSPDAVLAEVNDPCINCGRCTRACPASIQVHLVNRYAEFGLFAEAQRFHAEACHECGLCAYVCPSRRSLVQLMRLCVSEGAA